MIKRLLGLAVCLAIAPYCVSQVGTVHVYPAQDTNNTFTGSNVFTQPLTVSTLVESKTANGTIALNTLVKYDATGKVITVTTSDSGALGVALGAATAGGSVNVAMRGMSTCMADGAVAINDLVGVSSSVAGRCTDLGTSSSIGVGLASGIIGRAVSAASGAGSTFSIELYGPGHHGFGTAVPNTWTGPQSYALSVSKSSPVVDARHSDFAGGMKCDGVTDDAAALRAAISFASTGNGNGSIVQLPPGNCVIGSTVTVNTSGVILNGSGYGAFNAGNYGTTLRCTSTSSDCLAVTYTGSNPQKGWAIRNLVIYGPNSSINNTNTGHCIHLSSNGAQGVYDWDITDVNMQMCNQDGVFFDGPIYPWSSGLQNVWKGHLFNVTVGSAGQDCFGGSGWTEQLFFYGPYCGTAGRDAFHFANGAIPTSGTGTEIRIHIMDPSVSAIAYNQPGHVFYFQGNTGSIVSGTYWDGQYTNASCGYAYLQDTWNVQFALTGQRTKVPDACKVYEFATNAGDANSPGGNFGGSIDSINVYQSSTPSYKYLTLTSGRVAGFAFYYRGAGGTSSTLATPISISDWNSVPSDTNNYLNGPNPVQLISSSTTLGGGSVTAIITGSSAGTITLPASPTDGQLVVISNPSANDWTLSPGGGHTIGGCGLGYCPASMTLKVTQGVCLQYASYTGYWNPCGPLGTIFGASGATSHSFGLVPDPGSSSGTTRFLREDATWAVPGAPTVINMSASATISSATQTVNINGNTSGQTATLPLTPADKTTITIQNVSNFSWTIAAQGTNYIGGCGVNGLCPTSFTLMPGQGVQLQFLTYNGYWGFLTSAPVTFAASGSNHRPGFVPDPGSSAGTTRFLREDATFATFYIARGTQSLPTSSLAVGACITPITISASGVTSSTNINLTWGASITGVTGYDPASANILRVWAEPSANTITIKECNPAGNSGSITPGTMSVNYGAW